MKQLTITAKMIDQIRTVAGADIDPASIVVFEMINLDTKPISKIGSLFHGATAPLQTLMEAAAYPMAHGGVPTIFQHEMEDQLPFGKIFFSDVVEGDELRSLFYVPKTKTQLIADINAGVIDETSVGMRNKRLLCSECNWDYYSPESSLSNIFMQACANDHVIGSDGEKSKVRLILDGVETWYETSLVVRGAKRGAKILSAAKSRLSPEQQQRLAASGLPFEATYLQASHKQGSEQMSKELVDKVEAQATQIANLTTQLSASTVQVTELQAKVTPGEAAITELATTKGTLTTLQGSMTAVVTFLRTHAERALVATGKSKDALPADADAAKLMEVISEGQQNLVNMFEPGLHASNRPTDLPADKKSDRSNNAFSIRRALAAGG